MITQVFAKKAIFTLLLLCVAWVHGTEWIKNGDFENGKIEPWKFSTTHKNASMTIITDSAPPTGGNGVLGIMFAKDRRVDIKQNLKVGPGKYKFSAFMDTTRCTKPGGYVMIYLSGTLNGKWHNYGAIATPGTPPRTGWKKTEWTKYEKKITVPQSGEIKAVYIVLINITGTAMVDGVSLQDIGKNEEHKESTAEVKINGAETAAPKALFTSRKHRSLFPYNETPELGFELKNPSDQDTSVKIQFKTTDYFGQTILKSEKEYKLSPKECIKEILRYPECRQPGFYCTEAEWTSNGIRCSIQGSFVKVGPVPPKKDPLFGISYFASNDAASWALLGVGAKGVPFYWRDLRGTTKDREKLLNEIKNLKKHGIEPIGGFTMMYASTGSNSWLRWMPKGKVTKGQNPTIQDIEEVLVPFIEEMVKLTKPYIKHWFLNGEIDIVSQRKPETLKVYLDMTKFSYSAIHRANPESIVSGLCVSGAGENPAFPFIIKLLPELKDYLDGIAPDAYPKGQRYGKGYLTLNSEESKIRSFMQTALEMAKSAGKKYVSIAEKGPSIIRSTPLNSPYGRKQANILARDYILLKTLDIFTCLYFRPDNWNPKSLIDWGMWEKGYPRQVVSAYAATARIMAFAEFIQELKLHRDIPCWIFRKDGRYFAAIWYNGQEKLKVNLVSGIPAEAKDVQGNPIAIENGILYLGEAPDYLYTKDVGSLQKLLKDATANTKELSFDLDRQTAGKTILIIHNQAGHKINLKLKKAEVTGPTGKKIVPYQDEFALTPGEVKIVEKTLNGNSVAFTMETDGSRTYTVSADLKPILVPRVNNFDELEKKAVPQLLNDPIRQIPGYDDLKVHGVYTGLDDCSGSFQLGYNEKFLYLEVRVKDDIHLNDNPSARIFNGDCIQFAIDPKRDAKMRLMRGFLGYSNDDFNFVSGLARKKPYIQCYVASVETRAKLLGKPYHLTPEIIRDEQKKITLYRIRLALDDLVPLKPRKGGCFGFSLIIFDRDTPTGLHQMSFSEGVSHPFDPAKYPVFQFE
ncbi:MAG: hypothetical protein J5858_01860 [Lentisphaeria bacterium]|nr:hypothetical protein [Lentisphaeria bacterium]